MLEFILWFGGGALGYATALTAFSIGAVRLATGQVPWRSVPLVFCTLTFVFLTQHPFPDPSQMSCPVPSAAPQLRPFDYVAPMAALIREGAGLAEWFNSRWVLAAIMNFVVCAVIGLCWGLRGGGVATAALFGLGLSLACELSQLTGVWGLFPCAYRSFNVDDLMLNTLGVCAGALLFLPWHRSTSRRSDS